MGMPKYKRIYPRQATLTKHDLSETLMESNEKTEGKWSEKQTMARRNGMVEINNMYCTNKKKCNKKIALERLAERTTWTKGVGAGTENSLTWSLPHSYS